MRISFITPSPSTLKQEWYRDLHYQKVGVPNLAGWLRRAGFSDIRHYDFNNQVTRAYSRDRSSVRLMLYSDGAEVKRYLRTGRGPLAAHTDGLLDLLNVRNSRLFGISLTYFLGDTGEIALGIRLAQCLARALKARFPSSAVLLGGLQNMDTAFQRKEYIRLLKECPHIDYAVCGNAHRAILQICRALQEGRKPAAASPVKAARAGKALLFFEPSPGKGLPASARYFEPLPEGEMRDASVPQGFPAYDAVNCRGYAYTPSFIRKIYRLPAERLKLLRGPAERRKYLLLQVSFNEGCPFGCNFCCEAGGSVFSLSTSEAIDTLRRLKGELGCSHFLFYNPNFNPTAAYAKEMLRAIIKAKLDILWADCFNLRNIDAEMVSLMRDAGVIKVVAGLEYPTDRMLKFINKGLTVERADRALEALHKAGIWNHVLLITGLPTETWDDVREMERWLLRTDPFVDAYTVGSFHMVQGSPFHEHPEKFGLGIGRAMKLYSQSEFDESSGLSWGEKHAQNARSNSRVVEFINRMKGTPKLTGTRMEDSHLLMYLYRSLGHGRKDLIRSLYREARPVNPHISAVRAALEKRIASPSSGLSALLRAAGASISDIQETPEELEFTLEKGPVSARCSLRARSEDILLNPSPNRLHGVHFVLHFDVEGSVMLRSRALSALASRGAVSIRPVQPAACSPGTACFTASAAGASALFSVRLYPRPAVGISPSGGEQLPASTEASLARIFSAAAAEAKKDLAAGRGPLRQLKDLLPKVLAAVETR